MKELIIAFMLLIAAYIAQIERIEDPPPDTPTYWDQEVGGGGTAWRPY
jgi:hypothetical protein